MKKKEVLVKIRQVLFLVVFLGLLLVAGCRENPEYTQILEVNTQPVSGNDIRLLFITSDEYRWDQKQNEIRLNLEATVNGGQYNIVKVGTIYTEGYLLAAEVYYRER